MVDIGDGYEADPVDHDPFSQQSLSPYLEGDFPYHPDYIYHGTSDVHSPAIEANGFPAGTYFATNPDTSAIEAHNTAYGPSYSDVPKPGENVGGKPVVYAVPKQSLRGKGFIVDPSYEGSEYENGRAVIAQHPVESGRILSADELRTHTETALKQSGWKAAPMSAPPVVTRPGSGGLMNEEEQMLRAREEGQGEATGGRIEKQHGGKVVDDWQADPVDHDPFA